MRSTFERGRPNRRQAPSRPREGPTGTRPAWPSRVFWIAAAALIVWVTTPVFTPGDAVRAVRRTLDPPARPSTAERIVGIYARQTRTASFWTREPTVFRDGTAGMRRNFAAYDPRVTHKFRESKLKFYIPELVATAP